MDASPSSCTVFKTPSPRELEIAPLIRDHCKDKEIAQRLGIGTGTVHTHLDRMREKSDLHYRDELAAWALAHEHVDGVYVIVTDIEAMDAPLP
jgi:DNA-binding NarL/FixJ family response regulator